MSTGNSGSNAASKQNKERSRKLNVKEVKEHEDESCMNETSDQGPLFHEHRKSLRSKKKICDGNKSLHTHSSVENVESSVTLKKPGSSKVVDSEACSKHKPRRKLKTSSFVSKSKQKKKKSCFGEERNSNETCVTKCGLHQIDNRSKRKRKSDIQLDSQSSNKRSSRNYHLPRQKVDNFLHLPVEIKCYIFQLLSFWEILRLEHLSKKMQEAVLLYLQNVKSIDFNENIDNRKLFEGNLPTLTDDMFMCLLKKLPNLQNIYNFHPINLKGDEDWEDETCLRVGPVIRALVQCKSLKGVEISNADLLYALSVRNPKGVLKNVKIIGKFQNWNNLPSLYWLRRVELEAEMSVSHLHLTDCEINDLPEMDKHLEHLYLRNIQFVSNHPFQDFSALKLKSFVMSQCEGPRLPMRYLPLINALADAFRLTRVELQDIPHLGGIIKSVCVANWKARAFRRLESVVIGNCSNLQNADIGYLVISAACRIETLKVQPSLSKDAIFHALVAADVAINPGFQELCLGWHDPSTQSNCGGVSVSTYEQCSLTDSGMRIVGKCFPSIKKLDVRNCPYFKDPIDWLTPGEQYWKYLEELCICNCQCLHVDWFADFLPLLPNLKYLTLQKMFKEPPPGCSRVGLTAGTGIGAVTTMENNDIDDHIQVGQVENDLANENGAENHVMEDVANENGAENHVIEDEANENSAENHVIEDVANENGAENHVIEDEANENGAENHVIEDVANENGAENHVIGNVANENAALSPDSNRTERVHRLRHSRYNLRKSSRSSSTSHQVRVNTRSCSTSPKVRVNTRSCSTSPQVRVNTRSCSTSPQVRVNTRASSTLNEDRVNTKASSSSQSSKVNTRARSSSTTQWHVETNNSVNDRSRGKKRRHEHNTYSDKGQASDLDVNIHHSNTDKSGNTPSSSKHSTVSKRGKGLVTKHGIVSKAKSSSKKRKLKRKCNESAVINQSMETKTKKRVCTCKKPTRDIGCQVSTRDIKNSFKQASSGKRKTRRNSTTAEKVIEAGVYKPACMNINDGSVETCMIHRRSRPCMRDQSDGTSDPVCGQKYSKVLKISHSRLEYIKLDDVGMSSLTIDCPQLNTLSVSRCTMWKSIKFEDAPYLTNVHISQCRVLCEPQIIHQIYRLPNNCSKFVSLRPLHMVDESLFTNLQLNWAHRSNNFGSLMMFDRSDKPSETNYNKLRMRSWINMLERITVEAMAEFGFPDILEMEEQKKELNTMTGLSANGSKWNLLTDNPWIELLNQCPNIDDRYLTNPDSSKEGVYCMERKGHYSFWDAYGDLYDDIPAVRSLDIGLYNCNILTYINLCDISGTPTLDGLNVL